jgi:hypothetical protein
MEDWLKPENVKWLTQLVLPGFVIVYLRGRLLPNERDIYIGEVYLRDPGTGAWTPKGSGVWIAHGEIQSLEFWPEFRRSDVASPGAEPATVVSGPPNQGSGGLVAR